MILHCSLFFFHERVRPAKQPQGCLFTCIIHDQYQSWLGSVMSVDPFLTQTASSSDQMMRYQRLQTMKEKETERQREMAHSASVTPLFTAHSCVKSPVKHKMPPRPLSHAECLLRPSRAGEGRETRPNQQRILYQWRVTATPHGSTRKPKYAGTGLLTGWPNPNLNFTPCRSRYQIGARKRTTSGQTRRVDRFE